MLFEFLKCSLGYIKRTAGHTAIAAAAYRAGEKLYDAYYDETQERISLRGRIQDKKEIVREYDRTHQYAVKDNQRKRDENNLS